MARFTLFGGAADTSRRIAEADSVAVIGLGRFGTSLALELMAGGTEVLGIDADEETVQSLNGELTQVVRADSTKVEALRQLAVDEFDRVVVAIGSDLEASILTCSVLLGMKTPVIWAKAVTAQHGLILGAARRAPRDPARGRDGQRGRPPRARRRARLHRDRAGLRDREVRTAGAAARHALGQTGLRKEFGVTIAAFKKPGGQWHNADAETVLSEGDTILIVGPTRKAEEFAQLR